MAPRRQRSIGELASNPLQSRLTYQNHSARSNSRNRQFFIIPEDFDINSNNDVVINSVIAWSFYPKLLTREGKGWRNVGNNQTITLHATSINKRADQSIKWLSYYHIMQARNRNLNAHDTSAVDDFAIALLCGDAEFKVRDLLIKLSHYGNLTMLTLSADVFWCRLHRCESHPLRCAGLEVHVGFENPPHSLARNPIEHIPQPPPSTVL